MPRQQPQKEQEKRRSPMSTAALSDGCLVEVSSGFICPISTTVMVHPMMTRGGANFERSAILAWLEKNSGTCPVGTGEASNVSVSDLLPNHALESQIRGWQRNNDILVVDACVKSDGSEITVPPKFICPVSGQVMSSPLMTRGGLSFERCAILSWLEKGQGVCPITGEPLSASQLLPNRALEAEITFWCQNNGLIIVEECCSDHDYDDDEYDVVEESSIAEDGALDSSLQQLSLSAHSQRSARRSRQHQDPLSSAKSAHEPRKHNFVGFLRVDRGPLSSQSAHELRRRSSKSKDNPLSRRKSFMTRMLAAASADLRDANK